MQNKRQKTDRWLDLLYPPHCPICEQYIYQRRRADSTRLLCPACVQKVVRVGDRFCLKCGKPVLREGDAYCGDCQKRTHAFTQGRSVFLYQDEIRKSLYRFKYQNHREYARFYAAAMTAGLGEWILAQRIDCIVPIPLHPKRQRHRGYNQAELLAWRLGERLALPVETGMLLRVRQTVPLKDLTRMQRVRNMEQAFAVNTEPFAGERILLVDDIYTTGTTMDAAASVLRAAGAGEIFAVSAAIGG